MGGTEGDTERRAEREKGKVGEGDSKLGRMKRRKNQGSFAENRQAERGM